METASGLAGGNEDEEVAEVTALVLRALEDPGGDGGQEGGVPVEGMVLWHVCEKTYARSGQDESKTAMNFDGGQSGAFLDLKGACNLSQFS